MRKLILIFALNLIISVCKSQEPFAKCLYENDPSLLRQSTNNELFESKNGFFLSPIGTIRVLVVFAEIEYDLNPNKDPNPNEDCHHKIKNFDR